MLFRSRFHVNWTESVQYDIRRSAYHAFSPNNDPTGQATHFVNTVKASGGDWDFPLVLDVELRPIVPADVLDCLLTIESMIGQRPIIYTGVAVWNEIGGVSWAKDYPLWIAQYPLQADGTQYGHWDEMPLGSEPRLPNDWANWAIWQFSSKGDGNANGTQSASLDLNYVNEIGRAHV